MGIKLNCPKCNERMTFDFGGEGVHCTYCGYHPGTGLDEKIAEVQSKGPRPNVSISDPDSINARAVSLIPVSWAMR